MRDRNLVGESHPDFIKSKAQIIAFSAALAVIPLVSCIQKDGRQAKGGADSLEPVTEQKAHENDLKKDISRLGKTLLPIGKTCRLAGNDLEYAESDKSEKRVFGVLRDTDTARDIACKIRGQLILTKDSLISITKEDVKDGGGDVSLSMEKRTHRLARKDLRPYIGAHGEGFIAWAHSEDSVFLLSRDNVLRKMKAFERSDSMEEYDIKDDIVGAKMVFHSGALLMAMASGKLKMGRFLSGKAEFFEMQIPPAGDGADFFDCGQSLCFGKEGKREIEMIVGTEGVSFSLRML